MAVALLGVGAGCGSSKPAKDATDAPAGGDEPAPKWDTGSESADNARHPTFKSSSSGSSDDSSNKPSAAPPPPQSAPPAQHKEGEYDKEATEVILKRAARQVKDNCGAAKDENGKAIGPWGKTTVSVNLGHNGHSKGATVPAPYSDKPGGRCIMQAFANLTYPPWRGADTNVDWEVELVQPK